MATKKTTTKASAEAEKTTAVKTVKAAPAEEAAENKAAAKKVPAENKAVKAKAEEPAKKAVKKAAKPAAKKPAAKKEIKVKTVVEYYGKQVDEKNIIADVKKAWTRSGGKVGDIKSMELYIKPEEAAVYYVINGTETGAVAF